MKKEVQAIVDAIEKFKQGLGSHVERQELNEEQAVKLLGELAEVEKAVADLKGKCAGPLGDGIYVNRG